MKYFKNGNELVFMRTTKDDVDYIIKSILNDTFSGISKVSFIISSFWDMDNELDLISDALFHIYAYSGVKVVIYTLAQGGYDHKKYINKYIRAYLKNKGIHDVPRIYGGTLKYSDTSTGFKTEYIFARNGIKISVRVLIRELDYDHIEEYDDVEYEFFLKVKEYASRNRYIFKYGNIKYSDRILCKYYALTSEIALKEAYTLAEKLEKKEGNDT